MKKLLCFALITAIASTACFAGTDYRAEYHKNAIESDYPFERGVMELQVLGGAFANVSHSETLNYAIGTVRLGWMLNNPGGPGCLRGNFEFLVEGFGGGIFEGDGNGLAGAALLLRYNFVQPAARLVPYIQIAGGGVYSDAADEGSRLIGSDLSFNLGAAIGVRYMFSSRCALAIEGGYEHISNADTSARNLGVNAIGGQIGFSCFF